MNLWKYESCDVKICDIDGIEYEGCVIVVNSADDLDSDEDELTIEKKDGKLFGLKESEIKTIEILSNT